MSTNTRFTFLLSPFAVLLFALLAPAARRPALWLAILLTLLFSGCDLLGIGIG